MKFLDVGIPVWAINLYGQERLQKEIYAFAGTQRADKAISLFKSGRKIPDVGSALLHAIGVQEAPETLAHLDYDDSLPDIDIDFNDKKRHLVFEYMAEKYGEPNTAKIGNIARYKPRSALIAVAKALGIPPQATGQVKVAMIERGMADSRANNCLQDTLETTEPGKALVRAYPQVVSAGLIEGHASHTGVHAAGLLLCNAPMANYATITAEGIAQVEKHAAEVLGLLKIDMLGLTTMGILEDSGVPIDWYNLPLNDPETYKVFNEDRLCGIFQFSGNALRSLTMNFGQGRQIENIEQLSALTALARPGPFGAGITARYLDRSAGKTYDEIHPLVEQYMEDTYGLPLYQEQTMAIVQAIGKFDWAETTFIRKAISKRMGKEFFDTMWPRFAKGALENGIDEAAALTIWNLLNAMGAWQMNLSHTYSYSVISYWTAYLKAHHPLEFAAACLRNAKDEDDSIQLLREMHREGIFYVPFDPELSEVNWSAKDGKLVGGLLALYGYGEKKAQAWVDARNAGTLTEKQRAHALAAKNTFSDIFPIRTAYQSMYDDPASVGLPPGETLKQIVEFDSTQIGSFAFIGEIISKNPRDINEEVLIKKREGKRETAPFTFLDMRLRDDTETIGVRVGRHDFEKFGRELLEKVPLGAILLVRCRFIVMKTDAAASDTARKMGIRFGFIQKWKWLNRPVEEERKQA